MKETTRNLAIGVTVLLSLVILASMALLFQDLPGFLRTGYVVKVTFPSTGGVSQGAEVVMAGKRIGRVVSVSFLDPDEPAKGVIFELTIDHQYTLPGKVNVYATTHGFVGGVSVDLRLDNRPPGNERTLAILPKDGSAYIQGAEEAGGSSLLPADVISDAREALQGVSRLSQRLDTFMTPPAELAARAGSATAPAGAATAPAASGPTTTSAPAPALPNIYTTMNRLDGAMDAVNTILGDRETQANFKTGVANISRTAADLDTLSIKLLDDADKLGGVLTTLQSVAVKLEQGEGTFGKLLNDPKLYNSMVDAAAQLKGALASLQVVLEQWQHGGVTVRIK
jgi:phospholipid/cholesterol/gamma-HCH transport system substrate-binding protein